MSEKLKTYRVTDTVTYKRSWLVEAEDVEEALDKANDEGPVDDEHYTEEQVDNTPYRAEEER